MADLVDNATGQVVTVDDHDQAVAALQQGTHGLRGDAPVNLLAPDGSVVNADAANTAALFDAGYRLADSGSVAKDLERQQYGEGFGNEAAAFGEGVASGATLGLSDVVAKAVDDEYAAELAKRREYNPVSAGLGEATGVIGSAFLTGGATGAGGAVARALPASLAMRGAEALASKSAALGVKALGQTAIQGALEGALFGASKAVTDDYLNDHEITAERIALGAGLGGLTGGLFGAGGHALATGIGKAGDLGQKVVSGVMARIGGQADDGVRAGIPRFLEGSTAGRQLDDLVAEKAPRLTQLSSENATHADEMTILARGGLKKGALEKLMAGDPPPNLAGTVDNAAEVVNTLYDDFASAAVDSGQWGTGTAANRAFKAIKTDFDEVMPTVFQVGKNELRVPATPKEAAEMFRGLDKLKQRIGSERVKLQRSGEFDAADKVNNAYKVLQKHLEDGNLWGESAAAFQRENNAAMSSFFEVAKAYDANIALPYAQRIVRSERDGFVNIAHADPAKVTSALKSAGRFENSHVEKTIVEGAQRQANMLEVLGKNYDVGPEWAAKIKTARANADEIANTVGEMSRLGKMRDEFANAMASTEALPVIGTTLVKGAKTAGNLLQSARGLLSREGTAASQVASEVARAEVVHRAAVRAADRAEREIETTAKQVVERIVKSKTARSVADAASVLGYDFAAGTAGSVSGLSEHLADFLGDGESRKKTRAKLWSVRQVSPEMADAMEAQATRSAQFLAEKAAKAVPPKNPADVYGHLRKKTQDSAQAQRLGNYVDAVASPQKAIARIRNGEGRKEDMETLKALYPKMAQRLTAAILQKVTESKKIPSLEAQQEIAQLTGIPVGRGSDPRYTAQLQALIKEAPTSAVMQQDRQPRRKSGTPQVASMYGSPSDTRESTTQWVP